MSEALAMGGYGFYVWTSFAVFVAMLLWDLAMPTLRRRRFLRSLGLRLRREASRSARTPIDAEQQA